MNGWEILALVLLILFLIGQIRVGILAQYAGDGPLVYARVGPIRFKVFPLPKKDKGKKKRKKAGKVKKTAVKAKPAVGEVHSGGESAATGTAAADAAAPAPKKPEKKKMSLGGKLELVKEFLPLVLEAAGCFWEKLVMDELELRLTVGSPDPANTAMLYGQAHAALGALWRPLNEAFHVKNGRGHVEVDFEAESMTLYAKAALSLKVGQVLVLAVYFGVKALRRFIQYRKTKKAHAQTRKAV